MVSARPTTTPRPAAPKGPGLLELRRPTMVREDHTRASSRPRFDREATKQSSPAAHSTRIVVCQPKGVVMRGVFVLFFLAASLFASPHNHSYAADQPPTIDALEQYFFDIILGGNEWDGNLRFFRDEVAFAAYVADDDQNSLGRDSTIIRYANIVALFVHETCKRGPPVRLHRKNELGDAIIVIAASFSDASRHSAVQTVAELGGQNGSKFLADLLELDSSGRAVTQFSVQKDRFGLDKSLTIVVPSRLDGDWERAVWLALPRTYLGGRTSDAVPQSAFRTELREITLKQELLELDAYLLRKVYWAKQPLWWNREYLGEDTERNRFMFTKVTEALIKEHVREFSQDLHGLLDPVRPFGECYFP